MVANCKAKATEDDYIYIYIYIHPLTCSCACSEELFIFPTYKVVTYDLYIQNKYINDCEKL